MFSPHAIETFGPSVMAEMVEYFELEAETLPMEVSIRVPERTIAVPIRIFLLPIEKEIKKIRRGTEVLSLLFFLGAQEGNYSTFSTKK